MSIHRSDVPNLRITVRRDSSTITASHSAPQRTLHTPVCGPEPATS